jgi:hypothetical protein
MNGPATASPIRGSGHPIPLSAQLGLRSLVCYSFAKLWGAVFDLTIDLDHSVHFMMHVAHL